MENAAIMQLYDKISSKLLNLHWLEKLSLDKISIKKHIVDFSFLEKIKYMLDNQDYSCKAVLNLCENILNQIAKEHAPDNWLYYIYQFTLEKSFPHAVEIPLKKNLDPACYLYLEILRIISDFQKFAEDSTWQSQYPLIFLTEEEINDLEDPTEYKQFLTAFHDNYVYEMMKLNHEVAGYNTIDHICGVHYLALFIARQLKKSGLPIDLGRVSGATAGHDIGKYGCKKDEQHRVPYLHYYYTDLWFSNQHIVYIRHIAINHSVWDLELENLSLESLILIYSDFRVKNHKDENGKFAMHIYSLSESFKVILEKLDNVNTKKEKRYRRVYAKLKDFEDYMIHLGIHINPNPKVLMYPIEHKKKKFHYALMQGKDIIHNVKYLSIHHNIHLMYLLRNEYALESILQSARSEKDWTNLREYLRIFEEYSTYLTQKQKLITLNFLYENLIHPEDDIRKHCAKLIGALIAMFDEVYRKEVPENVSLLPPDTTSLELLKKYLKLFIFPDHKIIPKHQKWIGYSLSTMVASLFKHSKAKHNKHFLPQADNYIDLLLTYYNKNIYQREEIAFYLLETLKYIPIIHNDSRFDSLFEFLFEMLQEKNDSLRIAALETTYRLISHIRSSNVLMDKISSILLNKRALSNYTTENFLKLKIAINLNNDMLMQHASSFKIDKNKITSMFLSNLKAAIEPIIKKVQTEVLLEYALNDPENNGLQTALHFCNLLKMSASDQIRTRAGEAILEIAHYLSFEQRNEVAVELLSALEIDNYQFAEYIPPFLGQLILMLQPVELDELIDEFMEKIKQSSTILSSLLLKTLGVAIANYPKYALLFHEDEEIFQNRLKKMLGILLNGLVSYNPRVKQAAFSVIGKEIFGSNYLSFSEKNHIFQFIAKKILTLLTDNQEETLLFLGNAAALHHIYRFISDYIFFKGNYDLPIPEKIAFFPGTFDPFSLSHKQIAKSVRDLGFEVYLAIDEFSWSKQTLPHLLRKNIVNMSIADELNIYIYPEDFPTNLGNPEDLSQLKNNFPYSEVHIVVGSDVILNATSYQSPKFEGSIHTFPHIIFERNHLLPVKKNHIPLTSAINKINGKVTVLSLPSQYNEIGSIQLRSYINDNRDISSIVDPLAQKYIYENGFYRREPQYKTLMQDMSIEIDLIEHMDMDLINQLSYEVCKDFEDAREKFIQFFKKPSARLLVIKDMKDHGKIIGFSAYHRVQLSSLFYDLKDSRVSEYIREHSQGRIVIIDGIFTLPLKNQERMEQILLTETLSFCLAKDYEYAIFYNMLKDYTSLSLEEILKIQGFQKLSFSNENHPVFVVNMSSPCTLNLDMETIIKEPFRSNKKVIEAILRSRKKLQKALTNLYPGNLILSFDRDMLHNTLVRKICAENNVPTTPLTPRRLGPNMCVPFGTILNRTIIPNTVTKSLHTEKLFLPDMKDFMIGPFPHYTDLEIQIKMLRSFNRPIILVDDILHKGYRNNVIHPLLNKANIKVKKTIVGILSARGKELMERQGRRVDSAYYIPKLKAWFNENAMYPFFGGDTVWRGSTPQRNLVPSINLILPYTSPTFIKDASKNSQYTLSKICIQNAIDISTVIENEYHNIHERKLTLASLGEVFISPRCPDHGKNMRYDLNFGPSDYLQNDLEQLNRLEQAILNK
ncbi:cytidyltransferase [Crassaminicella indica]|uniref:Cytidyltransferase n=1 Tax=Crassaminicella indica TaxID=2855394 RepID=A0ABX8RAT6_9CLOT|nr:cytidyltransferase [Crassaminicella indica]QXM06163.1 cytidyltransferase [Crassaminicella indica]